MKRSKWTKLWFDPFAAFVISFAPCFNIAFAADNAVSLPAPASTSQPAPPASTTALPSLILVAGAPGQVEFATNFLRQVSLWTATAARAKADTLTIGLGNRDSDLDPNAGGAAVASATKPDRDKLRDALTNACNANSDSPLWLVFIGHGTFDGKEARFNLRGPDVTATELADWLRPIRRPLVFIDSTSASAPFLNKISGTNRVVVTATRSGNEQNFARFGEYYAKALSEPDSDLDKDGQTSVLEAFLYASAAVVEFYKSEGRLATEHALLDDNGDGLGTPADWFRGTRLVKTPQKKQATDGLRAHQMHLVLSPEEQALPAEVRKARDAIELEIARLRDAKASRPEQEYYRELEQLLTRLLQAYRLPL